MKFTLLLPVLDEIAGMKTVMPRIRRDLFEEILVVDGGSLDGSVEFARESGCRVIHQKSKGISDAYREGLAEVKTGGVVAFSPDGNSVPERLPELVAKMAEGYDMVIVSRYRDGAVSEDDDALTAFGNWMFTKLINILFGGRYTDTLGIFRAWKTEITRPLPALYPRAGIEPYLSIIAAKRQLRVAEIPGDEPARIGGQRKMRPFRNGVDIVRLILRELFRPGERPQ